MGCASGRYEAVSKPILAGFVAIESIGQEATAENLLLHAKPQAYFNFYAAVL